MTVIKNTMVGPLPCSCPNFTILDRTMYGASYIRSRNIPVPPATHTPHIFPHASVHAMCRTALNPVCLTCGKRGTAFHSSHYTCVFVLHNTALDEHACHKSCRAFLPCDVPMHASVRR